jgi:hypothetical protein
LYPICDPKGLAVKAQATAREMAAPTLTRKKREAEEVMKYH